MQLLLRCYLREEVVAVKSNRLLPEGQEPIETIENFEGRRFVMRITRNIITIHPTLSPIESVLLLTPLFFFRGTIESEGQEASDKRGARVVHGVHGFVPAVRYFMLAWVMVMFAFIVAGLAAFVSSLAISEWADRAWGSLSVVGMAVACLLFGFGVVGGLLLLYRGIRGSLRRYVESLAST
jgi:hypothetical protein